MPGMDFVDKKYVKNRPGKVDQRRSAVDFFLSICKTYCFPNKQIIISKMKINNRLFFPLSSASLPYHRRIED